MKTISRLSVLLSIPIILYLYLRQTNNLKTSDFKRLAFHMKEILQNMKPVLKPHTQNKQTANKIQNTLNGYSKEDEKKILDTAEGL
ncbi:MAG: hypothetical protein WCK43_04580 [bacterium]